MNKILIITTIVIPVLFFGGCAAESENITNLPEIEGFKMNKVYRLNQNMLASYTDPAGNRVLFKFNDSTATWKRTMFKTKKTSGNDG